MKFITHLNGGNWEKVIDTKWWPNQRDAVTVVGKYLQANTDNQAMIRMPTGTGKTVVIATLAQLCEDYQRVLVVAPSEYLVGQLQREISTNLWAKINETASINPRPTEVFTPKVFLTALKTVKDAGVLICTDQTLQLLQKNASAYLKLKKWATLVLVDEGHREPAPRWAEAVRTLEKPTVLFTATPYRSDLRLFQVTHDFFYSFTFGEALAAHLVRNVEFIEGNWQYDGTNRISEFVSKLLSARKSAETSLGLTEGSIRTIIRCGGAAEITAVANELNARGESVIGIHERFSNTKDALYRRTVPDPAVETANFWIHEDKLLEGLDDPRFRLIAILGALSNTRNLIQQIGRVIRNPQRLAGQKAFVLAHIQDDQERRWKSFIDYEKDVLDRKAKGHAELAAFDDFVSAHAKTPIFYLLGDFRRHVQPHEILDPRKVVQMRKSVLVRLKKPALSWNSLVISLTQELLSDNIKEFGKPYRDKSTFLQIFQSFEQTDIISEAYLDVRLGYLFAKHIGDYIFFFDSEGRTPECLKKATSVVPPDVLHRLLPDKSTTIKEVALVSGDFGNHAYRRRVVSTDSLHLVPPGLSDYVQVCSTATGRVDMSVNGKVVFRRRYLSFTKGRLSERTTPIIKYSEFAEWLDLIASDLENQAGIGDDTLKRFAKPHKYDESEEPCHILFDITSEALNTTGLDGTAVTTDPEKHWLVKNKTFSGEIDGKAFEAQIEFNNETARFEIKSDDLDKILVDGSGQLFTRYLNETQNFRVLLGNSTVYTQGSFFTPSLLPWKGGGNRLNIANIVTECACLRNVISEKGEDIAKANWGNTWPATSVFGAITDPTKIMAAAGFKPQILVCNDFGQTEIADFFALNEDEGVKTVVMVHAKNAANKTLKLSASAFHDVCSQAVRYLSFFNPTEGGRRLTTAMINNNWCPDREQFPKMKRLISNPGNHTAAEVAEKFKRAVSDVTFRREVWIVLGNGVSRSEFQAALEKTLPKPNVREIAYLFQSTWSAVASVGASLRVFCMP